MSENLEKSVVKIICESYHILWNEPWNKSNTRSNFGTGFCISIPSIRAHDYKLRSEKNKHKFIVSCAHVTTNPKHLFVNKSDHQYNYLARIEYILHELDMVILSIDCGDITNEFWDSIPPIPIGGWIQKASTVYTLGYPLGGKNISINKGVAARIDIMRYPGDSNVNGIVIQIDTPVNSGNSGGPAVVNGKVIGVVFLSVIGRGIEGMNYIVPIMLLEFFIRSISAGSFGPPEGNRQFCGLVNTYISYQSTNDIQLRQYFQIPNKITGVLVTRTGFARSALLEYDVLTHVNGIPLDNDGNIFVRYLHGTKDKNLAGDSDFVPFNFIIGMMCPGQPVELTVYRKSEIQKVVATTTPRYNPMPMYPNKSSLNYLIVANMAFVPLSMMLINSFQELMFRTDRLEAIPNISEMVVLTKILKLDDHTPTYFNLIPSMVRTVNGIVIQSLSHMNSVIKKICGKKKSTPVVFEFYYEPSVIIITTNEIRQNTKLVMAENGIAKQYVGPK